MLYLNKESRQEGKELEERRKYNGTNAEFNELLKRRRAREDKEAKRVARNARDKKSRALRKLL